MPRYVMGRPFESLARAAQRGVEVGAALGDRFYTRPSPVPASLRRGHVYGRTAGTGMMANPTAMPRARMTAAMMIATDRFPF